MRSLMSSNPVPSAKENLISLFDEIRKKVNKFQSIITLLKIILLTLKFFIFFCFILLNAAVPSNVCTYIMIYLIVHLRSHLQ